MTFDDNTATADEALPCALGLLVGTLALMTAHAGPETAAPGDIGTQRGLMARKIVSNLFFLQHHPDAPPPLRQVAANLHVRWLSMAGSQATTSAAPATAGVPAGTQWH